MLKPFGADVCFILGIIKRSSGSDPPPVLKSRWGFNVYEMQKTAPRTNTWLVVAALPFAWHMKARTCFKMPSHLTLSYDCHIDNKHCQCREGKRDALIINEYGRSSLGKRHRCQCKSSPASCGISASSLSSSHTHS